MSLRSFFSEIKYFIYPNRCVNCDSAVSKGDVLCSECMELWEKEKISPCRNCGRGHIYCTCLLKQDEHNKVFSVFHLAEYAKESVAKSIIVQMKRRQEMILPSLLQKKCVIISV